MRLGRLVAAGLAAGAAAGFLGALLRPRPVAHGGSDGDRPATGWTDLAVRVPDSAVITEPAYATAAVTDPAPAPLDVDALADGAASAAPRAAG